MKPIYKNNALNKMYYFSNKSLVWFIMILIIFITGCMYKNNNDLIKDNIYKDYLKKLPISIRTLQKLTDDNIDEIKKYVESNYLKNKNNVNFESNGECYELCYKIYSFAYDLNKKNENNGKISNFTQQTMQYYMYKKYYGEPNIIDSETLLKNEENGIDLNTIVNSSFWKIYKEYIIDELIVKTELVWDRMGECNCIYDDDLEYKKFQFVDMNDDGVMELIVPRNREKYDSEEDIIIYTMHNGNVYRIILDNYFSDEGSGYTQTHYFIDNYNIIVESLDNFDGDGCQYFTIRDGKLFLLDDIYIPNVAGVESGYSNYRHNGEIVTEKEVNDIMGKYSYEKSNKVPTTIYLRKLKFN